MIEDKRGLFCEIFLPIIVVLLGCAIGKISFIIIKKILYKYKKFYIIIYNYKKL